MDEKKFSNINCLYVNNCIVKILILFIIINVSLLSECEIYSPIKRENGGCIVGNCEYSEYKSGICTVENDIIKTQWFTSFINFTEEDYLYTLITTTENGDVIASSTRYEEPNTSKYYYGLKKNGRPYFNNNGEESSIKKIESDTIRYEGNIFGIKLKGNNNNKEYIIGFGIYEAYFELYDFDNNMIYKKPGTNFFNTYYNYFHSAAILKIEGKDNYYIIGIIEKNENNYYFNLMKLQFTSPDITTYSPILKKIKFECYNSKIVSCFETESKNIICFFRDKSNKYVISVFDQELNSLLNSTLLEIKYYIDGDDIFLKCVHFKNESGVFFYYETKNSPAIQFKKYNSGEMVRHFSSINEIKIEYKSYDIEIKNNNFLKINDKEFCLINVNTEKEQLKVVIIFNYAEENIKLRYYQFLCYQYFYFKFGNQFSATIYNGLIAIATNYYLG